MPPLVRRRPLLERIKAYLDPYDFFLWLAEQVNDDSYDDTLNAWATHVGIAFNLVFIIARGATREVIVDDVFSDKASTGWFAWLSAFLVHLLTLICCLNAFHTFSRTKHYRLFEQPVDIAPSTPAARRVRVDSSPATASPLRYVKDAIARATTGHHEPDAEQEVWEVTIWDPKQFSLTLFTLFSPGHLLVYYTLLPARATDARPSVTVLLAIIFGIVLSVQLGYMNTSFTQQTKDKALIQGEVMHEYNTKFVHPSLNKLMRDVATQTRESSMTPKGTRTREVDVYTPIVIINRGFATNPNTNYAGHYSPQTQTPSAAPRRDSASSFAATPAYGSRVNGYTQTMQPGETPQLYSSPVKANHDQSRPFREGDHLSLNNHAASPLRKSMSSQVLRQEQASSTGRHSLDNGRDVGNRHYTGRFS